MKRPEETNYFKLNPTKERKFEQDKLLIEDLINRDVFVLPDSFGLSSEIHFWLEEHGWKVDHVQEGINEWVRYLKPL